MKVFVTGATGVLGRRVVDRLVARGDEVTALARTPDRADALRRVGATPVLGDLSDATALGEGARGQDAVCNLATSIPSSGRAAFSRAWDDNNRIRTEGSRRLVDAAGAAGIERFVQESIAFTYADGGDRWLDEDAPVDAVPIAAGALVAEAQARELAGGVALRFGQFYAPDATHTIDAVKAARRGLATLLGGPETYRPTVTADDAADAVVVALAAPPGTWNVADDDPLTNAEAAAALAAAVGRERLRLPPGLVGQLGGRRVAPLARSQRVSNRRFREATGWAPATPDVRVGWPAVVEAMGRG